MEKVTLRSVSQDGVKFTLKEKTWKVLMSVAWEYGWRADKSLFLAFDRAVVSNQDSMGLGNALETALLKGAQVVLGSQGASAVIGELAFDGEQGCVYYTGHGTIRALIDFCRKGSFLITSRPILEEFHDCEAPVLGWCPICKDAFRGYYDDGYTDFLTCDKCETKAVFLSHGFSAAPNTRREIERHKDYLEVKPYAPHDDELRWEIRVKLPESWALTEEQEAKKKLILESFQLFVREVRSFYDDPLPAEWGRSVKAPF